MSVNAISSSFSASSASGSSTSQLSEDTKKKLQALGLDPTKYTSEAQAQAAIQEALARQTQQPPKPEAVNMDSIKTEVQELASSMGVTVGSNDKIDDILNNISLKITELQASAGTDSSKLADVNSYQTKYTTIENELSQLKASKSMTGANALANYNKAALGLSS